MRTFIAAHCFIGKDTKITNFTIKPDHILAIFGAHDLNSKQENLRFERSPRQIIIHPDWISHLLDSLSYDADLAVLKFDPKIPLGKYIKPICLWTAEHEPTVKKGTVAGWGRRKSEVKPGPFLPSFLQVPIPSDRQCLAGQTLIATVSSTRTFCAGLQSEQSGVCEGDSGSGFYILVDGVFYLRGIFSGATVTDGGDCNTVQHAVYTDLREFKDWIAAKTDLIY